MPCCRGLPVPPRQIINRPWLGIKGRRSGRQASAKAITVKIDTLGSVTVIALASHADPGACWAVRQRCKAIQSFKAHVGADSDIALVEALGVTPG